MGPTRLAATALPTLPLLLLATRAPGRGGYGGDDDGSDDDSGSGDDDDSVGSADDDTSSGGGTVGGVRTALGHPQFVGTNRHRFVGLAVVDGVAWDDAERTLRIPQRPFPYTPTEPWTCRVSARAPDTWGAAERVVTGAEGPGTVVKMGELDVAEVTVAGGGGATRARRRP